MFKKFLILISNIVNIDKYNLNKQEFIGIRNDF